MKITRFDAHDRLDHLKKDQSQVIAQGCEDCLRNNPDSLAFQIYSPYVYVFAHPRTADDGLNKRMLWQPRLTKPKAQTNSYLFRAKSRSDEIEVCWFIPPREMWSEFIKGNVTESEHVLWSIQQFENNREELERPYPEDLSDAQVKHIWQCIARDKQQRLRVQNIKKTILHTDLS